MWVYRHISPEVCPENERFAEVAAERDYAARPARIAENSGQAAASALMLGGDGDGDGGEDVSAAMARVGLCGGMRDVSYQVLNI
jgi:hypothetical protein